MSGAILHHLAYLAHLLATAIGVTAILWLTRRAAPWRWSSAILALGCALLAAGTFLASDPYIPFHDFRIAYYPAGRAVLDDPSALRELTARGVSGFVNMPVVAYVFAPFGALPFPAASALFTVVGLGLIVVAWRLLVSLARLGRTEAWLLALLFAANGPLQNSLREGNSSHMVLAALAGGWALLRAGRSGWAGALLAAAAILKPPLLLFGLFFVVRRDVKGATAFGAVGLGTALASVAIFGWTQNLQWFDACVLRFSQNWVAAFNVQSIPAFLSRLGDGGARLLDWNAYSPAPEERLAAQVLTGLLYAAAALAWTWRSPVQASAPQPRATARLDLQFLLVVCLAVVSSPLSWSHYYCWLLLPAGFFLGQPASSRPALMLGWVAIFLVTPLVWPLRLLPPFAGVYGGFAVSHLLFGGLLAFGLVAWRLAAASIVRQPALRTSAIPAASPAK